MSAGQAHARNRFSGTICTSNAVACGGVLQCGMRGTADPFWLSTARANATSRHCFNGSSCSRCTCDVPMHVLGWHHTAASANHSDQDTPCQPCSKTPEKPSRQAHS
eukprot:1771322-Rhodomonas_salina.2